jgi:hypothetical protein
MIGSNRAFIRITLSAALFAAGVALGASDDVANGYDAVTMGQVAGHYQGGTLLPGEHAPTLADAEAIQRDLDIANGLDPLTTGQVAGNYAGGTVLVGEVVPYASGRTQTAQRKD